MRPLFLSFFCLGLASCARSQPQTTARSRPTTAAKIPLRTLIVSGGPRADYNQYAIESNARYLEKITAAARSQRILFADGSKKSRTISVLETRPDGAARAVFAYLFDTPDDSQREVLRASTLGHIDGPATRDAVLQSVQKLVGEMKSGERGLLYFTGHGSPGEKPGGLFGGRPQDDFENTTYALWNDDTLSTRQLGAALQNWPAKVPLVLVMVQCHAGGFANLLFEGGDPQNPVWNRDFCGFFAATGDRAASGCTSEVDEADYEDFTTHFFAALSGISRDGKRIAGADYDGNGMVSPLEAFAYSNVQDGSIDVPICTSDAYLRAIFPSQNRDTAWLRTPYSQLIQGAAPWQKAILDGLSKSLGLSGEARLSAAMAAHDRVERRVDGAEDSSAEALEKPEIARGFDTLEDDVKAKFPGLGASHRSPAFGRAKLAALKYLQTRGADVETLNRALSAAVSEASADETREAMLWRFVRASRTLVLQKRLNEQGGAAQKATFARLRASESRAVL